MIAVPVLIHGTTENQKIVRVHTHAPRSRRAVSGEEHLWCRFTDEEPVIPPGAVVLMAHALMVQQPVVKPRDAP